MIDSTRGISVQPPPTADPPRFEVPLFRMRIDRVRDELTNLGADESALVTLGGMSPGLVHVVLSTGQANRATLRRLKRSLRMCWSLKVGAPMDVKHHSRITMKYLSDDIS
jgi:hypothetical protein